MLSYRGVLFPSSCGLSMDHYKTLGVSENATPEEIKTAFRKLAMQHHPDRNGDEAEFKKINEAYDTLSDPVRKEQYDNNRAMAFQTDFSSVFDDAFTSFFSAKQTRTKKNLTTLVEISVTLEEVFTGKQVVADVNLPSGNTKTIKFNIPPGVDDGQQVRYPNIGDDTVAGSPPGDLIVRIKVLPHPKFERYDTNLVYTCKISAFDAMLGTTVTIKTIDNRELLVTIPAGSQPSTILKCKDAGLPKLGSKVIGALIVKLDIQLPICKNNEQRAAVEKLKELFSE